MKKFDAESLAMSLEQVSRVLSVEIEKELYSEYVLGRLPTLLSYEKMLADPSQTNAIQKYLISVKSALNQPNRFYDIYRNSRFATLLTLLSKAITEGDITSCMGWSNVRDKLRSTVDLETFDSAAFEVLVASHYRRLGFSVDFIAPRGGDKSPDLKIYNHEMSFYAECKRFNRIKQNTLDFRDDFRVGFQQLKYLLIKDRWIVLDIGFKSSTTSINLPILFDRLIRCITTKMGFENYDYRILFKEFPAKSLDQFLLHPSPMFDYQMSGFEHSKHHGHFWIGSSRSADVSAFKHLSGLSSWIDDVSSSIGIKYCILNKKELHERSQNFGFENF